MGLMDNAVNRATQLKDVVQKLEDAANTQLNTSLTQPRRYAWHAFNDVVQHLYPVEDGTIELPPLSGGPTRIGRSVERVLSLAQHHPVAGVVLISDGHGSLDGARSALRKIGARVHVVPIGDLNPPPTISLGQVVAPRSAFSEDRIPIRVTVHHEGNDTNDTSALIRLVDEQGIEQATSTLQLTSGGKETVVLSVIPEVSGLAQWTIELDVGGQVLESVPWSVMVHDQPMRVLYVEGRPRFMYRFVAPLLTRESSIDVSIVLQSADSEAAPDGNQPIRRLPSGQDEWDVFDLIVLGDVDPRSFTEQQFDALRDHVLKGAGLLWIPGAGISTEAWADTPLAGLLPVLASGGTTIAKGVVQRSPEGIDLGLPALPAMPLEWALVPGAMQPQARPLVELVQQDQTRSPLVVLLPTGQGHAGWIGTDDFWRWRRTTQPRAGDAFLLGMMRLLGRHGAPVEPLLQVQPDPVAGSTSMIVLDGAMLDGDGAVKPLEVEILDHRGVPLQRVALQRDMREGRWRGPWRPPIQGLRRLHLVIDGHTVTTEVLVKPIDAEDVRPGVDMAALSALVQETGGSIVLPDMVHTIPSLIAPQSRRTTTLIDEGPALGWLLWGVLVAVLSVEWSLRRWNALA
jgi:hypothetical protein